MTNPELVPLFTELGRTKRIEETGPQIVEFVNHPEKRALRLISPGNGSRFIVCGTSGSGKTRAISLANGLLPTNERIAESQEFLREKDPSRAIQIVNDTELAYEASMHIGFNVINGYLAKALEAKGVKVFWLDSGSFGDHWKDGEHGT
jgi:hypothetical protein